MKILATATLLIAMTGFAQSTSDTIPTAPTEHPTRIPYVLLGTWKVGRAYDGGPTDLDEKQSLQIEKLRLQLTPDALKVCGRSIAIKKIAISVMTYDQFATRYSRGPNRIGMSGEKITELEINSYEVTHACGDFSDPGTDVIFDEHNHFAIEVDNLYYPLTRTK